jgi:hypothetical protein
MLEGAALALTFFGFALLYAAVPRRAPFPRRWTASPLWPIVARGLASASFAASLALFSAREGWLSGGFQALTALMASASLFALGAPLAPRLVWGLALASPALGLALVLGAGHAG